MKLVNNISGAEIKVSAKEFRTLQEKGKLKNFTWEEKKPSKELEGIVEENEKKTNSND